MTGLPGLCPSLSILELPDTARSRPDELSLEIGPASDPCPHILHSFFLELRTLGYIYIKIVLGYESNFY
ncbi:hypothetical protein BpHYR1_006416 [Brachionus plicatilis]|uniref:Uncharacterized protein n=1 Tax=Brachionus plicatilis TaxID=10195 RepID=A0A3M7P2X6_BRAPC|nr:hypothetical protein BpHYR1_006416 [Brachionus plicatilis]